MADTKTTTERRPYWIRFYHGECPVCGRDVSYRERVYVSPKPTSDDKRHVQLPDAESYCHCLERQ